MAIVGGAVALSGAAWVVTDAAWEDEEPVWQVITERGAVTTDYGGSGLGWFEAPRCTPPPGLRTTTYACAELRSGSGRVPPPAPACTPPPGHRSEPFLCIREGPSR